jgi:1-phosphofructokinase family hexose kinase
LNVQKLIRKYFLSIDKKHCWIIFSGSLPPNINSDFYAGLIKKIKTNHFYIKCALDTDEEPLKKGILSSPNLIKPNFYELERFTNNKIKKFSHLSIIGENLINSGIEYILITLGKKGAIGFSKDDVFWAKHPIVKPKSSVGCGDVFLSGFLHKISSGNSFEKSLQFAVGCGTAKVQQEGTKMPQISEVKKILKDVSVVSCRPVPYELKKLFLLRDFE